MRPGVRRWMYWNGHWWWHEANGHGWRGPERDRAQAVFLGDSMIYGHGVHGGDTVPAAFERLTGLDTANLGQQGTCAPQQMVLLRRRGLPLRPRQVFLCAHPTDLADLTRMYDEAELERFVAGGAPPRVRREYAGPHPWDPLWLWARHFGLPLRAGGVLGSLVRGLRERRFQEFAAARDPFVPTAGELVEVAPELGAGTGAGAGVAWQAHRHAIAEIRAECDRLGARLVLFDLGYPRAFTAAMEGLAADLGVAYSPAGRVALRRAQAGARVYLANDGHWTPQGAAIVAEALAATLGGRTVRD
jgi:hypothetical protein